MVRSDLSRPFKVALLDGLLAADQSVMDYGCGRGGDVVRLRAGGFDCTGWDPAHAPDGVRRAADVVNLGYVVNVIENPAERREALQRAWALARGLLVVSARLQDEAPTTSSVTLADGHLNRLGAFQKFYEQDELRAWIDHTLSAQSVAAAPGVFYVFRNVADRLTFLASRHRRATATPRLRLSDALARENHDLLQALAGFLAARGRLPGEDELPEYGHIIGALGSLPRAFRLLRNVSDPAIWSLVRRAREEDLLIFLAMARFHGRRSFSELSLALQRDVKAFFGSFARAVAEADAQLFAVGQPAARQEAIEQAEFGKTLPKAFYVHAGSLVDLPLTLRLYEACAQAYLGAVEGANIIKFGRDEPKLSYLAYPDFEGDPHPALATSTSVHLQTFRGRTLDYRASRNPPILHRKDAFIPFTHPLRRRFERLTRQEERLGLLDETSSIGTRDGWNARLQAGGYVLRGHQVRRVLSSADRLAAH